ncbi:MAG: hypothetical protein GTN78_13590 [Gemmatimonadales bacterium]|nr:hypothetical protein [Gemmatimonadales bacterium]NIR01210.1 hypothetical protein [Gemmatimonadales bacterium]NIS65233.1 hypothetical protein [Gemmatimonadales bacterium]
MNLEDWAGAPVFIAMALVWTSQTSLAQESLTYDPQAEFTVEQLREDLTFLRDVLEGNHAALYRFHDKASFDASFDSVFARIDGPMTELAFFGLIAPVVAMIDCVHTRIRPSDSLRAYTRRNDVYLPLDIDFVDNRAYIIRNYRDQTPVAVGSEVVAINGVPVSSLLREFLSSTPSDGHNETHILYWVNRNSHSIFSSALGYPESYRIELVEPPNAATRVLIVPGMSGSEIATAVEERGPQGRMPPLQLEVIDSLKAAVLTIGTFVSDPADSFHEFLVTSFAELESRGTQSLIVDVRGNYGGHPDNSVDLLRHLADSTFTYFAPEVGNELVHPVEPLETAFRGDKYFLIDGGSFSTTGHFISIVKYHDLGTLIGQESGGTFICNDNSMRLTLPNTRIGGRVARTTFATAVTGISREGGIQPDHVVKPTVDDLLAGVDVALERVLALVAEKRGATDF